MSLWQQWWQSWWALARTADGLALILLGMCIIALPMMIGWSRQRRSWLEREHALRTQQQEIDSQYHAAQWQLDETQRQLRLAEQRLEQREEQLAVAHQSQLSHERQRAELSTRLDTERHHFQQQVKQLQTAESRLSDTFKRLAGEIFEDKTRRFSELSQERLGGLLNPIQTQLKDFGKLVQETHQRDISRHAVLEKELQNLRQLNDRLGDEARQLVDALRGDVKMMGTWGELKLERLLTLAGLEAGREFDLQYTVKDDHGRLLRPDAVVWLPDGKGIIIDAKVSLEHYRRFRAASDEEERQAAFKQHLRSLHTHIRALSQKEYHQLMDLQSPDFVLMFVPSEPAYLDALQGDDSLLTEAQRLNVMLLSPANLLATLRTVGSVWHSWRQNENALEIARRAGLLYDKFIGFTANLGEVGSRLDQAQSAYERAFGQLSRGSGNLVRQVEQLRQLGARTSKRQDSKLLRSDDDLPAESIEDRDVVDDV